MTQHQQQQQQSQQPPARDTDTRLGILETAVSDIRSVMQDIRSDLKTRGSINWAPVNIMLAVCTVAGGMFFTWVNSNNGRLETAIGKVEMKTDGFMKREDIVAQQEALRLAIGDKFQVAKEKNDLRQTMTDARIERAERDHDALAKLVVPRGEHDTIRQLQQRDYDLLRARIERVEGRFEKRTDGLGRDIEKLSEHTIPRTEALARNDAQDRVTAMIRGELDEHVRAFNERQQRTIDRLDALPRK